MKIVTPAMIQRAESKLNHIPDKLPEGMKVVGTVHNEAIKKLWVLFDIYAARAKKAEQAQEDPERDHTDKLALEELKAEESRNGFLKDVVRDVMWFEIQSDLNTFGERELHMFSSWQVVYKTGDNPLSTMMKTLFGGTGRVQ